MIRGIQGAILICIASCFILIAGCAAKKQHASPSASQARQKEQTKVKSKPSQKPYTVMGKKYEPLDTHVGFVQTGVASWYGKDFHGKRTSNGEAYDMHELTAAHKTLPLGVYVKVRNTDNNREVVVRVNDRGPFVKGRIIDLSYAAARELGVDVVGTAPVRVEALGYKAEGESQYTSAENYDKGTYTVQIGSFKDYHNAERLMREMRNIFGFSEIEETAISGERFHRVYAGKYTSLRDAERAEEDFSTHGYPGSFVVSLE